MNELDLTDQKSVQDLTDHYNNLDLTDQRDSTAPEPSTPSPKKSPKIYQKLQMGTARSPSQSPTKSSPSPTFHEYLEDQTHAEFASGENEANFMAKKSVSMFNSDTHSRTKKRSIEHIMPEDHMSFQPD